VLDLLSLVDDSLHGPGILGSRMLKWAYIVARLTRIACISWNLPDKQNPSVSARDLCGTKPGHMAGANKNCSKKMKTIRLPFSFSRKTRPFVEADESLYHPENLEFQRTSCSDPIGRVDLSLEIRRFQGISIGGSVDIFLKNPEDEFLFCFLKHRVSIDLIRHHTLFSGDGPLSMSIGCGLLSGLHSLRSVESFEIVKIHRIYHFYSYVTCNRPHWTYILADEDVSVKSSPLKFLISCNNEKEKLDPCTLSMQGTKMNFFQFNPLLPEVEEFIQSVNNSDPYVRRHDALGL
ncbi:LOW QUALITY PROTEIN: hypothetical protein HID58_013612, partial [Brassica napus]